VIIVGVSHNKWNYVLYYSAVLDLVVYVFLTLDCVSGATYIVPVTSAESSHATCSGVMCIVVQWNLYPLFLKGPQKIKDGCV